MGRSRSRDGEDGEEAEKKPKLSMDPVVFVDSSRNGASDEEAEKKPKLSLDPVVSVDSSRNGASDEEAEKKPKLSMDPVVSVDSSRNERIPDTVVYFRYRNHDLHRFRPKLAELGKIVSGPCNLPFLDDFAYVLYSTQDAADKALQQPIKIPKLGEELICRNIDDAVLDAVRQVAYNLVADHVPPHPANTLLYVSNVHYKATLDQLRAFFSQFGEIADGPIWFEMEPESEFGITLIVYKTEEGVKEAVQQPHYLFAGHQVRCSRDVEPIVQLYPELFLDYLHCFVDFAIKQRLLGVGGAHI